MEIQNALSLSQKEGLIATLDMKERSLKTSSFEKWKVVIPGDLVLNRFKAHLGVFFSSSLRGIVSFHYGVFSPRKNLNTKYFELLYHSTPFKAIFAGRSNGMTVGLQNLSNQNFYSTRTLVPGKNEQDKIVLFIENETKGLDKVVARIQREIKLLNEYKSSLIANVVTGKVDVREAVRNLPATTEDIPPEPDTEDLEDEFEPEPTEAA